MRFEILKGYAPSPPVVFGGASEPTPNEESRGPPRFWGDAVIAPGNKQRLKNLIKRGTDSYRVETQVSGPCFAARTKV